MIFGARFSRRTLLQGVTLLGGSLANAQSLPQVPYRNYARCLPDYLRHLAREAYERRSQALAALTSETAIRERQRWVRETFWKLTGGEPVRTPLNARVTRSVEKKGFRVDCVLFESQPGLHVSANLYIPTGVTGPFPGVLFQPGHSSNGKAYAGYQLCCQGLALLGFVVLAIDPMGQGERTYYPGDIPWQSRLAGGADDEHTLPGKQMLLVGDTATRLQTWDAVRSLDYLAQHPLVDPKRLASAGQSGGGTNTMLLAAVDDRLAAAVACCANTENVAAKDFIPPGATDDAEQNFIGSGAVGFDRWDLLYPLAPLPLLIHSSSKDFAGTYSPNYIASGVEEFRRLEGVYQRLGHPERIAWRDSLLPHGLSYDLRLSTYNWLRRWLQGKAEPLTEEPAVAALPDRELFVSPNGNVVKAFGGETPATLARKVPRRSMDPKVELAALLRVQRSTGPATVTTLGRTAFRDVAIEAIEVQSAVGVWLPVWVYRPKIGRSTQTLLVLDPAGRQEWREGGLYDRLARRGVTVCAADIRGIGDMLPEFSGGAARHAQTHNSEQHYAWSSLILGETLVSQRVSDILTLATAMAQLTSASSMHLAAKGILTTPALFAAALEPKFSAVLLSGGIASFLEVLNATEFPAGGYFVSAQEQGQDIFGSFVPGLLTKTDLPQIAAALGPRRVLLSPKALGGELLDEAALRRVYGAAPHIQLAPQQWDAGVERLLNL
jgi:dienelactone hydrolase